MSVDISELRDSLQQWGDQIVDTAVRSLGQELDDDCPVSEGTGDNTPGTLRDSRTEVASGLHAEIDYRADYASYVSEGTPPHVIEGNALLSFYWPRVGKVMVLHSVQHPGTDPNPWWTNAMTDENWNSHLQDAADVVPFS